jgi:Helicase associated domain
MESERRQRLEALPGWSWDARSDNWEEGCSYLKRFSDREGHCRVSNNYKTADGYRLGQWVRVQRSNKDTTDRERRQRLEALPGWSWEARSDKWEDGFSQLKQFSDREGHCRVPAIYRIDDGYRLGGWVNTQRNNKEPMDPERRQRLEALPGWSWDPLSDQWNEGFSNLKEFSDHHGHCRVLRGCKTDDSYPLAQWVKVQRKNKDKMDPDRRQRLEELPGWVWKVGK